MQSALLPELADEVVEVFTGDSLEEAMAYAVATLGPDLTVRRARKVRKGVQGLRGKETYEVAAVPAPRTSSEDALGDAFAALLHDAEAREEAPTAAHPAPAHPAPRVRRTVRPATVTPPPFALEVEPEPAPLAVHPELPVAPLHVPSPSPAPAPEPEPVAVHVPRPRKASPAKAVPVTAATPKKPASQPAKRPAPKATATPVRRTPARAASPVAGVPAWSRTRLAALGLPRRVLVALPAKDPRDDAGWVRALSRALAKALPPAATPGDAHPLVVDGYGVAGVLGILDAARRGMTPGTITLEGRTAPATPMELALVVRAALVG